MVNLNAGEFTLPLGEKTYIMGIVNVTPDSFSDGGKYFDPDAALAHALSLIEDGADIIDIGAQSTKPGSLDITAAEELERLKPVLEILKGKISVPLSIDTFYPEVAEYALANGASIINDVDGFFSEDIAGFCKQKNAAYVITHNPLNSGTKVEYPNGVVTAVRDFFLSCIGRAVKMQLPFENLVLDPGVGFSKNRDDDCTILKNMNELKISPCALLCGVSRKRVTAFEGAGVDDRDYSTAVANTAAIAGGADIIRVHNVKAAKGARDVADRIFR